MTTVLLLLAGLVLAAPDPDPTHADAISTSAEVDLGLAGTPAGPPVTDPEELRVRSSHMAKGLRCPVCQGLSSADSQAESAVAMRTRAERLVAAGYSDRQIRDYFVARYGDWVLLEPPVRGRHLMVWLAPLMALGLGGLAVGSKVLEARRARPVGPAPGTDAATPAVADAGGSPEETDPYKRRILDELEG